MRLFTAIVLQNKIVYMYTCLCTYLCLSVQTDPSEQLLSGKYSLHEIKTQENLTISYCTIKLQFKDGYLFQAK